MACANAAPPPPAAPTPAADSTPGPAEPEGSAVYPQFNAPKPGDTVAVMDTSLGKMTFVFYPEAAPKAVENFLTHAKDGYYDGTVFHRVMTNFMIQGGDPLGTGTGGESIWGEGFGIEVDPNVRHFRGAIAMAQSSLPNSIGSQFYVVHGGPMDENLASRLREMLDDQDGVMGQDGTGKTVLVKDRYPAEVINKYLEIGGAVQLDFNYTVFGQLVDGFDTLDKIANVECDMSDPNSPRPLKDVVINSVTVTTY